MSNFRLEKVNNLSGFLYDCKSLRNINFTNFYTDSTKLTGLGSVFRDCSSLVELDLTGLLTGEITNVEHLFRNCTNLITLNLTGWDLSNVTYWGGMFSGCSNDLKITCSAENKALIIANTDLTETNFN